MGPTSKEAILKALGHIVDELLQQRETGRRTLEEVRNLAKSQADQKQDHEQLKLVVSQQQRSANGKGHRP